MFQRFKTVTYLKLLVVFFCLIYGYFSFQHYYLQPMDGDQLENNTRESLAFCMANPRWKLSLQLHKQLGIQ